MQPEKIQASRDKHCRERIENSDSPPSLLMARVIPRESSNLHFFICNWSEFELLRDEMNGGKIDQMNIFQLSSTVQNDINLIWRMVRNLFPSTNNLPNFDKAALLRNFMLKIWQIEPILERIMNAEKYRNMDEKDLEKLIVLFYEGAFFEEQKMTRAEILNVFTPFWVYYYTKMVLPIVDLELEKSELLAIIWLLFFDNAYTNISPECQEMCWNIKKVILRELKNFQIEREFDEMRFIDTVETLEIIERGEKKFMEEMLICEMHNVRIHEDFKSILMENRS